jgi:hypothetical protein
MPTTRRRIKRPMTTVLTPEAIECWRIGDFHGLNRALGVKPWDISPFDGDLFPGTRARELYEALSQYGPPGRWDRHGEPLGPAEDPVG